MAACDVNKNNLYAVAKSIRKHNFQNVFPSLQKYEAPNNKSNKKFVSPVCTK